MTWESDNAIAGVFGLLDKNWNDILYHQCVSGGKIPTSADLELLHLLITRTLPVTESERNVFNIIAYTFYYRLPIDAFIGLILNNPGFHSFALVIHDNRVINSILPSERTIDFDWNHGSPIVKSRIIVPNDDYYDSEVTNDDQDDGASSAQIDDTQIDDTQIDDTQIDDRSYVTNEDPKPKLAKSTKPKRNIQIRIGTANKLPAKLTVGRLVKKQQKIPQLKQLDRDDIIRQMETNTEDDKPKTHALLSLKSIITNKLKTKHEITVNIKSEADFPNLTDSPEDEPKETPEVEDHTEPITEDVEDEQTQESDNPVVETEDSMKSDISLKSLCISPNWCDENTGIDGKPQDLIP